jgi:hypothetical protein
MRRLLVCLRRWLLLLLLWFHPFSLAVILLLLFGVLCNAE